MSKGWVYIVGLLVVGVYFWGAKNMYFHQDDLDWFILANRPTLDVMQAPIGDHVNYLWRILLSIEWNLFGFNFAPYLAVSLLLHILVIGLLYKITSETTKRKDLAAMVAIIFALNTNWTEIILWTSGQTISITALFVLLAMSAIWNKKGEFVWLLLSSWTSALSIGVVVASMWVFKKLRWTGVIILAVLGLIYKIWSTDGTKIAYSFDWMLKVGEVAILMSVNTAIGRLLIPFDRYEIIRIVLVIVIGSILIWKYPIKLREIWSDKWSRFLIIQLAFYNLIVAAGRAQFGVGIMRAERYAYLGLALVLLIGVRILRNAKIGRWIWVVPILLSLQIIGFYRRADDYIVRPQHLRELVKMIENGEDKSERGEYLPHFVLNDQRLKYGDLYSLLKR